MTDERDAIREAMMTGQSVRDALTEHARTAGPETALRDQLADALQRHTEATALPTPFPPDLPEGPWLGAARRANEDRADALVPVVEAAIARAEQRYKGVAEGLAIEARDLVTKLGEAEQQRDEQRERADNAEDRLRKATDAYSHLHAQATATDVTRTRWRLRAEQAEVLLRDLVDPDDCHFDHNGGCQAHGYLSLQPGEQCPHAEAKALLAALTPPEAPR